MAAVRRVLVIRHSEIDQPGFFGEVMEAAGIEWRPCDPWQGEPLPALEDYDAVLAMGGPQQADEEHLHPWLAAEKALLRDAVAQDMPVLGVCLGCQLLADAHGGTVAPLARGRGRHPRLRADRGGPRRPALRRAADGAAHHAVAPERGDRDAAAGGAARHLRGLRGSGLSAGAARLRRAVPHGGGCGFGAGDRAFPRIRRRAGASCRAKARSRAWWRMPRAKRRRCAPTAAGSSENFVGLMEAGSAQRPAA